MRRNINRSLENVSNKIIHIRFLARIGNNENIKIVLSKEEKDALDKSIKNFRLAISKLKTSINNAIENINEYFEKLKERGECENVK